MSQDNRIKLELDSISKGITHENTYTVILGESEGTRKIAIIIGNSEASSIAMVINNMTSPRPFTHDLMKTILDLFDVKLEEVFIKSVKEGVFYAELVCNQNGQIHRIDSRTSDAIALSVRYKCPIFANTAVIDEVGIETQAKTSTEIVVQEPSKPQKTSMQDLSLDELESKLEDAVQSEDYETAARIRDEIQKRKR